MVKLKYLCKSFTTPIIQNELELKPQEGLFPVYGASGLAGYSKTCATDEKYLGIVKDGAGVGRIRIYPEYSSLLGTLAYIVPNEKTDIRWLKYAIDAMSLGERIDSTTIPHIYFSEYGNRYVCDLDIDEQIRIAGYLDQQCAHIDAVIEKTKASIEEYKKLKQAVITQAVTKSIRCDRLMKDSGIEWIGQIPADWSIQRFKNLGKCWNGLTYSPDDMCDEGNGTLVLRSSNIQNGKLVFDDNVYVNCDVPAKVKVHYQDILICSRNGSAKLIGKNAIIGENVDAAFGAFMMVYRSVAPRYLRYILNSDVFMYNLSSFLTSTVNQLTAGVFNNIKFPYTADVEEQEEIVRYLDDKCSSIDRLIDKKEQILTEMESYKKSLIYEYVTGKKEAPQSCQ